MTRLTLLLGTALFVSACMNNGGLTDPVAEELVTTPAPVGEALEDPTDGLENEISAEG